MSALQKLKTLDLMLCSQCLDDILFIDNSEFENGSRISGRTVAKQTNSCAKETSFLDLNIIYYIIIYDSGYLVLLYKCLYKLFGLLSRLLTSLIRNYFPKRPSGAPLHSL